MRIEVPKRTADYRIVSDDPQNWHLVANRFIRQGEEIIVESGAQYEIDVGGIDYVEVSLQETGEMKKVYSATSAVPQDSSCDQTALEIPWCLMNHSCDPNTKDDWDGSADQYLADVVTVAARNIANGEELTFNYNLEQYDYQAPFHCRCGSPDCVGEIKGFMKLSEFHQKRCLALASPFIQERFCKLQPVTKTCLI